METRPALRPAVLPLLWFLGSAWISDPASAMQVTVQNPFNVVILFQPVTLQCNYQTSSTQPPIVLWKYKSYCRSRLADAFNPSSQESQITNQLQQNNPGYNPYVECQDNSRTVRVVATKQGNAVTLGDFYQGRRITITNNADLSIDQTAWGDSGVYYCTVTSSQDLQGNNEAYAELIVLDWVFVVLVVLGFFLVLMLFGICWCQCCPHTCCCYVRCPCCSEKCCCPEALYVAGKAATAGVPSVYAPTIYASSNHLKPGGPATMIPMGPISPVYNGYGVDYDRASSVGGNSSQVPLLRDTDSAANAAVRSGYRIQANQQDDSMRVLYYMEKELANFDPTRPGQPDGRLEKASGMSELSSLHEDDRRYELRQGLGRLRGQAMSPISDMEEESMRSSENRRLLPPSRHDHYEDSPPRSYTRRPRSRSMDALDDLDRDRNPYPARPRSRGRHGSDEEWHRCDYSPDSRNDYEHYGGRRSRSRDDLQDLERSHYDDRLLEEALRRKRAGGREDLDHASASSGRSGNRKNRDDGFPPPPPPPPYTETESVSSHGKNDRKLRRNHAVSRESLVV
ncbi:lipolysis-stimulated lipoprotein receptor isoform X2 [Rhineura floridana]|uniref:lipolysis-stimulated lipoprotein receptor isoform X2 n=1 Tax=Rhineura floridana TaxID=261503 RepID=UPI002AC87886|nr:lipolysis-stimulated lipoprotein receptor isoform X2 [Rhineura floridana]